MRDDLGSQLRPDGSASLLVSFWQLHLFAGQSKRCATLGQMGKVNALAGHAARLRDGQPPSCNPHLAVCCLSRKRAQCPHARCKYPTSMGTIHDEIKPICPLLIQGSHPLRAAERAQTPGRTASRLRCSCLRGHRSVAQRLDICWASMKGSHATQTHSCELFGSFARR